MNKDNNDKFVRIVKIFKWWRKNNCPDTVKYPKGITLEKIVADNLYDCNNQYEKIVFNGATFIVSSAFFHIQIPTSSSAFFF